MDAQNVVEPASTKQPAPASPKRGAQESSKPSESSHPIHHKPKSTTAATAATTAAATTTATNNTKSTTTGTAAITNNNNNTPNTITAATISAATSATQNNKSAAVTDQPSITARNHLKPESTSNSLNTHDDNDTGPDQNSDAETIVLPGKDVSPSKRPSRPKTIKYEEQSDGEIDESLPTLKKPVKGSMRDDRNGNSNGNGHGNGHGSAGPHDDDDVSSTLSRRSRLLDHEKHPRSKDNSSGLSSAPPSPPAQSRRSGSQQSSHRRRKSGDAHSESGSEASKSHQNRVPLKDKSKSVDRLLPGKRKALKAESDDEGESRKVRRPRISDAGLDSSREKDNNRMSSNFRQNHDKQSSQARSTSPHERSHRRSLSTQLPSSSSTNGFSNKKRRVPAPLQSTDYNSDDSSAGGSPHPRSSKLRNVATPLTGDSTISPARMVPHKKHVDNHGQTLFAKACAKGEYETAKKRLAERPEDLNFADYAGNTPLQVAALNGHEEIVKLLIEAGCKLDCRNSDKDTPLLDAVENGHLGVVKLLLEAGVNPRKADAEGHEPLDKVPEDLDNAEKIRAALIEAKEKIGELRRTSEDHQPQDVQDTVSSHEAESPRRSPAASGSNSLASQRRGGTVRSTKTSNHLLYMSLDEKTLRQAAARGDEETVTRVLLVREGCNDPEALVNAARGGHDVVMELLLALGRANPDPSPVPGLPTQYGTPMLAAIGQENTKCIKLLLDQTNFDPTRRFKSETYYEIARRREGPMWKEEEHMLKEAYDARKKIPKGTSKNKSPGKRERETETESRRAARNSDGSRPPKRAPLSPSRDAENTKKHSSSKAPSSPKEKRRSSPSGNDDQTSPKRGPGRPKKEDRAASDREHSPVTAKVPPSKPKRAESDLVVGSSDGEAVKPRRKLISGKDLKGEREKQRRASMASNNSATDRGEGRSDDTPEKTRVSEKYHDRTKALKRDESRDRLSLGDGSSKRHRSSVTPPHHGSGDKDEGEAPVKRRKLDPESKEKRHLQNPSPDRKSKRDASRDPAKRPKLQESDRKESFKAKKSDRDRREFDKSSPSEKASITVFSEKPDVEMHDAPSGSSESSKEQLEKERKEAEKREAEKREAELAAEAKKQEEERRRREEERRRQEEEERRQQEAAAEKKRLEEEEQKRIEAEEKRRREEEEREKAEKARLEEERRQREEQERKRQEEEEKRRKEEEEARQREQEERERRIREAAEEARRLREEEERKERERKRLAREAEREAELLRIRQEQERIRLSKLPPLLRWLECCPDPKQTELAKLFATAQGVRYDTINPNATGTAEGREQWLLNTQAALLLGEKDLSLSRCKRYQPTISGRI